MAIQRAGQRVGIAAALVIGLTLVGAARVSAASVRIPGVGIFDLSGSACSGPLGSYADFFRYPRIVLTGSLHGCCYTKVDTVKDDEPTSSIYQESTGGIRKCAPCRQSPSSHDSEGVPIADW
jgi:hypothetical protein